MKGTRLRAAPASFTALCGKLMSSEAGDFKGKRAERCPPLSLKGNKWKGPRRGADFEQLLSPVSRGHWDQHQRWLGQAEPERQDAASVTMFLKSTADPFYCLFLWEWQFNQRIRWSPRPLDPQSSSWQHYWDEPKVHEIPSWRIPGGFSLLRQTVFASVRRQLGWKTPLDRQLLQVTIYRESLQQGYLQKLNYGRPTFYLHCTGSGARAHVPRQPWHLDVLVSIMRQLSMWLSQRFALFVAREAHLLESRLQSRFRPSWRKIPACPPAFLSSRRPESLVYRPITSACDSADKPQSLRVSHSEALWPSVRLAHWLHVPGKAKVAKDKVVVVPTVCFCDSQLWKKHLLSSLF